MATYHATYIFDGNQIPDLGSGGTLLLSVITNTNLDLTQSGGFIVSDFVGWNQTLADTSASQIDAMLLANGMVSTTTITYDNVQYITIDITSTSNVITPITIYNYQPGYIGSIFSSFANTTSSTLCEDCEELTFSACETSYTIVAGLEIGTTYTIGITDRNGKVWKQDVVADGSGDVTVDTTEFPRGFFTPESGPKQLQVWTNADLTGAELITVGSIEYTCLVLSFQYVTDTTV